MDRAQIAGAAPGAPASGYRPLSDTVHDTWLWLTHAVAAGRAPDPGASPVSLGLDPDREHEVLASIYYPAPG